ncbi:MAG: type II toxin-antitoxin system RelE/ParE family toxin [Trueperaceae bacterium]|nr:type II toxin-antitoxin system RelE/ParE family toxin [Trueperaceae bacterium]
MAAWDVVLLAPVVAWYEGLLEDDPRTAEQVAAALDLLEEFGPSLGRPLVDTLRGSQLPNLKELRPGSRGRSEVRLLFVFDPQRRAVVLVAGDKAGRWRDWYRESIRLAEARYAAWMAEEVDT